MMSITSNVPSTPKGNHYGRVIPAHAKAAIFNLPSYQELNNAKLGERESVLWQNFCKDLHRLADEDEDLAEKGGVAPGQEDLKAIIDRGIAPSVMRLLNDKYEMVWKFERTFYAKLIGVKRARTLLWISGGGLIRGLLHMSLLFASVILSFLGLFKIVPMSVYIAAVVVHSLHNVHTRALLSDTAIYWNLMYSFKSIVQICTTIAGGILAGFLLDWDYRGWLFMFSMIPMAFDLVSYEAMNANIRRSLDFLWTGIIIEFILIICFFNIGLIPDLQTNSIICTVEIDNMLIPFTTLSVFTQTMTANVLLLFNHLSFNFRWGNRLSSAVVHLEGTDDPASTSLERLDYLKEFADRFKPY